MSVSFSTRAKADLKEIEAYITRDDPIRAASFTDELVGACDAIGDAPTAHPVAWRLSAPGIRKRVHRPYLIFYRVAGTRVEILRVLQGARDYPALIEDAP